MHAVQGAGRSALLALDGMRLLTTSMLGTCWVLSPYSQEGHKHGRQRSRTAAAALR